VQEIKTAAGSVIPAAAITATSKRAVVRRMRVMRLSANNLSTLSIPRRMVGKNPQHRVLRREVAQAGFTPERRRPWLRFGLAIDGMD
jgi:hypothetical protein